MNQRTLSSLAIIKVNWDRGRGYSENFLPFIAEILKTAKTEVVSAEEIQNGINTQFGLNIPQGAISTMLKMAAKKGYVKKQNKTFTRNMDKLEKVTLGSDRQEAIRKQNYLIQKLQDFCKKAGGLTWTNEIAEAALLTYLEQYQTPILAASLAGEPLIKVQQRGKIDNAEYYVQLFVDHLHSADPQGFDYLETVVKGLMLSDALFFPDLGRIDQNFHKLDAYFDTNFLLRALGFAGTSLQASHLELLNLLYNLNVNLKCFNHTLIEMRGILYGAQYQLRDPRGTAPYTGETIEFLIKNGYSPSDIQIIIENLASKLAAINIRVAPIPKYSKDLSVDEERLKNVLQREVHYYKPESLNHDLASLTSIHRLRHGNAFSNIEECRAIFVTTNDSLVHASKIFFEEYCGKYAIPHCILDDVFTTIVWLKKPMQAPDLPRKMIIANCYAALNPAHDLWRKYYDEITSLRTKGIISEDDFHILRFSAEARRILMEETKGNTVAFSKGTPNEILEKARKAMTEELQIEINAQTKRAEAAESTNIKLRIRLNSFSRTVGKIVSRIILCILVLAFIFVTFYKKTDYSMNGLFAFKILITLLMLLMSTFSTLNAIRGTHFIDIARWFEIKISNKMEKCLESFIPK